MNFFSKFFGSNSLNNKKVADLSWMEIDIHNHILPSIDDGSKSIEQSLDLVQKLNKMGLKNFVCTPHVMEDVHPNTPETIGEAHLKLTQALKETDNDTKIKFSAEYMIDSGIEKWIGSNQLCPLPSNYMLIEMSYLNESQALFKTIQDIQNLGLKPILAHPERYNYYHMNFNIYKQIKDAGCALQLNLLSISRYYGEHVKSTALTLIKSGMYDFVGTDLHHEKHLNALNEVALKYNIPDLLIPCTIRNGELL